MKKLLSVVAILVLAATMLPSLGVAGLRGAWDPITNSDGLFTGHNSAALRRVPSGTSSSIEEWFAFVTSSGILGSESVGEIWLNLNLSQGAATSSNDPLGIGVTDILDYRRPLLKDPNGIVSYLDPAWSNDGKWLAYIVTDASAQVGDLYVQKYDQDNLFSLLVDLSDGVLDGPFTFSAAQASTPIGAPILIASGAGLYAVRHPSWRPDGKQIAFEATYTGLSSDIYTVDVDLTTATVGLPVRRTFDDTRAEIQPAYKPTPSASTTLAYVSNKFGPFAIFLLDLTGVWPANSSLAEPAFAAVSHQNPSWTPNGASIYYDAPQGEDANNPPSIWKLDLATQAKCSMNVDQSGSFDPDVSRFTRTKAVEGIQYNYFLFTSQAAGFGLNIWRGEWIQNCIAPLAMGVELSPNTLNISSPACNPDSLPNCQTSNETITATISFPPETIAKGYHAQSLNAGTLEGVRMRRSIVASPVMMGLRARVQPTTANGNAGGEPFPDYDDQTNGGVEQIAIKWTRRTMEARLVALGLVNQQVPMEVTAYSNTVGRQFKGYGYLQVNTGPHVASAIRLVQNSPNPFNPQTKIKFAVSKAGTVSVRVFDVQGKLVKTIVNQWYPQGEHVVTWDGKGEHGRASASGIYYAKAFTSDGASDQMRMVMIK